MVVGILAATFLANALAANAAFHFAFNTPTQCDDLKFSWTGGVPPFNIHIFPVFGTPQNITVPATAFSNGVGSFSTPVLFAKTDKLVLSMSDATGFNTGGTTKVLAVGPSVSGNQCNVTKVPTAFFYHTPGALVQCSNFIFTDYPAATLPVTVFAMIPGGNSVILTGAESIEWTANVAAGNDMIFAMVDAQGRQGGSTAIKSVEQSDDTTCLNLKTPVPIKLTASAPSATNTPTKAAPTVTKSGSATPSTSQSSTPEPEKGSNIALIAGSIAGVCVALAVIASLGFFCWQHRRKQRNAWDPPANKRQSQRSVDLLSAPPPPSAYIGSYNNNNNPSTTSLQRATSPFDDPPLPVGYEPRPFTLSTPTEPIPDIAAAGSNPGQAPNRRISNTTANTSRTKASMAGITSSTQQPRLILHTDMDEPQPNEDGFIELPPQYSATRRPVDLYQRPGQSDQSIHSSQSAHLMPSVPESPTSTHSQPQGQSPYMRSGDPFSSQTSVWASAGSESPHAPPPQPSQYRQPQPQQWQQRQEYHDRL